MIPPSRWRLYIVLDTGALEHRDPHAVASAALAGGADALQLRAKGWPVRRQMALAQALLPLACAHGVPLLINDHIDIALAVGAHGVHLGVDDLPLPAARALMPTGLIGYSPEDVADARRAELAGASYLGVGPFATTATKPDAGRAIGTAGVRCMAAAVDLPILAIGGITPRNAHQARAAGAAGVAVAAAVLQDPAPQRAARALRTALLDPNDA